MREQRLEELLERYPDLQGSQTAIKEAFVLLKQCFALEGKLLLAGNGGSASDCEHIVGELMKGFRLGRALAPEDKHALREAGDDGYLAAHLQQALPAFSLANEPAFLSAFANDVAADLTFAQQVFGYGRAGDVFWGISTSGNSPNIIHAFVAARSRGMRTILLTGRDGGKARKWADVTITVPYQETYLIQERHLPIYHTLCLMLEEEFFNEEIAGGA